MKTMMKIMHVLASNANGGAENACIDIIEALDDAKVKQHIVLRNHAGRCERLNSRDIPYTKIGFRGGWDIFSKIALRKTIMKTKPDIVLTWLSRAAQNLPEKSTLGTDHPIYISRLGGYYKMKYYTKTDHFIGNTPDICTYIKNQHIPDNQVTYIPNFAHKPEQTIEQTSRESLDIPDGAAVFITASRLHPDKGIDVFLKGLAQCPNAYGCIAGTGPVEKDLKTLAEDLGITDRVRFLGWRDDIPALLKMADFFVLASRLEPFGNAFLNAWAQQKPVIASASQGPSQFITHGKDGLIFPIDDHEKLAEHMIYAVKSSDKAAQIAKNGYDHFIQSFSKDRCAQSYIDLFQRLIGYSSCEK